MFRYANRTVSLQEKMAVMTDDMLLSRFFPDIRKIPCVIKAPYREDKHPSMSLYVSKTTGKVMFKDFSKGDSGSLLDLIARVSRLSFAETINMIWERHAIDPVRVSVSRPVRKTTSSGCQLQVSDRAWTDTDFEYWESYGVDRMTLISEKVVPISHYFIGERMYVADKLAYAFIEHVDGKAYYKVYQPMNTCGNKWRNNYPPGTFSLYSSLPETHYLCCVCSSLKDALCLRSQTGVPAIAPQGEGYDIPDDVVEDLNRRFGRVVLFYDNDEAGVEYMRKQSERTGWDYMVLKDREAKDISDTYRMFGKDKFKEKITELFNELWITI